MQDFADMLPDPAQQGSNPRVAVVVLNWNGWGDTLECLETVFRNKYSSYSVIVCDNGSEDGSLGNIRAWAEGRLDACVPKKHPLRHLSFPPVPKPITYVEYDRAQAELGGEADDTWPRLVLIQTGGNLGYAGGNNVALRYTMRRGGFAYVWLLNNDTVVEPDALIHLVQRMRDSSDAGICGSTLLYRDQPDTIQALGGATYNKWLAVPRHLGGRSPANRAVEAGAVEARLSYIVGASMLVSQTFVREVGPLCEDYFLYFDEIDWAVRARGRYRLAYAPRSIVYHKEGGTTEGGKSFTSDFYALTNRLVFTRRYYPWALPTVYLGLIVSLVNRVRRRQWDRVSMIVRIILSIRGGQGAWQGAQQRLGPRRPEQATPKLDS